MNELLRWLLMTFAWTVVLLLFVLWRIPRFITRRVIRRFGENFGGDPWNKLRYNGLPDASANPLVATSPDMLLIFGTYDVTNGPVSIRCKVPPLDNYWSISLYAWNTDNFFVLNDRTARLRAFDVVVVPPDATHANKKEDEEVVVAPTPKGIVIVRAVVKDRDNREEITQLEGIMRQIAIIPHSEIAK